LVDLLAWFFGGLHQLLNPVLSPLLSFVNPVCTFLADGVYALLGLMPAWMALTLISIALGLVMLVAFRYTSNQKQIRRCKDAIKANLLALRLYKDDLVVTFKTQVRLFAAVARLQRYVLAPVVVMTLPMLLLFGQMAAHHQWRPLAPGEAAILRVEFAGSAIPDLGDIQIKSPPGVAAEVGPLPGRGDVVWRVRGVNPGRHQVEISIGEGAFRKEIVVGKPLDRVSPMRTAPSWGRQLLFPIEAALDRSASVQAISIEYPPLAHRFYGWWIVWVLVISMATGFAFRSRFGVTF